MERTCCPRKRDDDDRDHDDHDNDDHDNDDHDDDDDDDDDENYQLTSGTLTFVFKSAVQMMKSSLQCKRNWVACASLRFEGYVDQRGACTESRALRAFRK